MRVAGGSISVGGAHLRDVVTEEELAEVVLDRRRQIVQPGGATEPGGDGGVALHLVDLGDGGPRRAPVVPRLDRPRDAQEVAHRHPVFDVSGCPVVDGGGDPRIRHLLSPPGDDPRAYRKRLPMGVDPNTPATARMAWESSRFADKTAEFG